jgi:hypothetical protein
MYRVLRLNLEQGQLYKYVEEELHIHLSSADKLLLLAELREVDHTCLIDLWTHTCDVLWSAGYRSRKFESSMEEDRQIERYWCRRFERFMPVTSPSP